MAQVEAPLPEPAGGEVRVRVVASALNPADYKVILGTMKFLHGRRRPLVVGYDFSGTVDAIGPAVTGVAPGDDVFGFLPYGPFNQQGAFAEALIAKCDAIAKKPASVPHERAAAAVTTGLTALQAIRDVGQLPATGRPQVLVTGVSGGVGSMAIAVAQRLGATVTAVGSGRGLEIARRLGAAAVIDRTKQSVPGHLSAQFDVVFDAAAAYRWREWRGALKPNGTYVTTLPSLAFVVDKFRSLLAGSRVGFVNVKSRATDLRLLASWLEDGLDVSVLSTIPVREVPAGLRRLKEGGGRIAVRVADGF